MSEIIFSEKPGEIYDIFQGLWTLANYDIVKDKKIKLGIEEDNQYEEELLNLFENGKIDTLKLKSFFHLELEPEKTMLISDSWQFTSLKEYLDNIYNCDISDVKKGVIRIIDVINEDQEEKLRAINSKIKDFEDNEKIIEHITNKSISSSLKWEMYLLLKDIDKYMKEYVDFIRKYVKDHKQASLKRKDEVEELNTMLKDNLNTSGIDYLNQVINTIVKLENYKKIYVTTSAVKTLYIGDDQKGENCFIIIGTRLKDVWNALERKGATESNLELLRDVFESTRFNIIKLLLNRDYYVQEIADALALSKANVSYHMNFLLKSKVVTIEKDGQRNYYHINKDVIKSSYDYIGNELDL